MSKPNGILTMNPEKYREIDGVVFDEASYARHCQPKNEEAPSHETAPEASEPAQSAAPAPVFAVDPYPEGWYPADDERPPVPIMGGAVPSTAGEETVVSASGETTVIQTVCVPCGSGSGSGSYVTSYTTSYRTSYSGSGSGSFRFGSGSCPVGGYGLELI